MTKIALRVIFCILAYLVVLGYIAQFAHAQTKVIISGHAGDITDNTQTPAPLVAVKFSLAYCGANQPRVFGVANPVSTNATFTADPVTLAITGQVWPNDLMSCGGVTGGTRYNVQWLVNGVRVGPQQCYQVLSPGPFNLDTAQPCATVPPPTPPPGTQDAHVRNLTVDGLLSGFNAVFSGDVTAASFHFAATGFHSFCGNGSGDFYPYALKQDFTFQCAAFPTPAAVTFNGRAGPTLMPASGDYNFGAISGKLGSAQTDSTTVYPGTMNKSQTWDHTPTLCPSSGGLAQFPTGTDAAGNATGCALPATSHGVVATSTFTSCALVHFGDTDQNCAGTGTWSATISGAYTTVCTINSGWMGGSADTTGVSQTTFGINGTTSTSFGYYIANIHDNAAGATVVFTCAAIQ